MHQLLEWLALPQFGLSTVFVVSFVSATLLPLGSEPAVFGLIKLNPAQRKKAAELALKKIRAKKSAPKG